MNKKYLLLLFVVIISIVLANYLINITDVVKDNFSPILIRRRRDRQTTTTKSLVNFAKPIINKKDKPLKL